MEEGRRRIPFFGGLLSALLLGVALDYPEYRGAAWIALLPLLYSLFRHARRPGMRLAHALTFGFVITAWQLHWFYGAIYDFRSTHELKS